jgi:drug/metabolite transporter, DME family
MNPIRAQRDGRVRPAGRAAWTRIGVIGVLAALYQSCYFTAVALTSVALATLVTIGTAPVIVLGVYRVTGRRTGRLAPVAACLALTGLGQRLSATGIAGAAILMAAVIVTVRGTRAPRTMLAAFLP